jgi:hypothetical protein
MSKDEKNAAAFFLLLFLAWWLRPKEIVTATIDYNPGPDPTTYRPGDI